MKYTNEFDTLNEAISRKDVHGLIIHSSHGFQYTSFEYESICKSNEITIQVFYRVIALIKNNSYM